MKTIVYNDRIETLNDRNERHSFNDKPAIEWDDGCKWWYKNERLHRMDGPAIINIDDSYICHNYYQNGLRHRVLKPAIIEWEYSIKTFESYYIKDRLHNPIGPARLRYAPFYNFKREFYIHDKKLYFDEFIKQLEERLNV